MMLILFCSCADYYNVLNSWWLQRGKMFIWAADKYKLRHSVFYVSLFCSLFMVDKKNFISHCRDLRTRWMKWCGSVTVKMFKILHFIQFKLSWVGTLRPKQFVRFLSYFKFIKFKEHKFIFGHDYCDGIDYILISHERYCRDLVRLG